MSVIQRIIQPKICLQPYIEYYYIWESQGFQDFSKCQRVYPSGNIILVFHYKQPFYFKKFRGELVQEPRTVICGQQTSFYELIPSRESGMIFIVFKTFGAGVFFDIPMMEITDENLALAEILKEQTDSIEEKLQTANDIDSKVKIIEEFMISRLQNCHKTLGRLNESIKEKGTKSLPEKVSDMADRANLSIKQYERLFSTYSGLNPKRYLQIMRFKKTLNQLHAYTDLTSLALDNGYYDQAHFIHDFKSFTDMTPMTFKKDMGRCP